MMKKHFLLIVSLLAGVCAFAQNGITNPHRFGQGEDSVKCVQAISLYSVNLKNKNYDVAYENWKTVFNNYPVARVDTYTNGEKLLKALIAATTDEAKKAAYVNELMALYDQQIKYIDKLQEITKTPLSAGGVLGKRALAYISYVPKASLDSAYNMLAKSVDMEKGQSEYIVTQQFMKMSAQKYKANKASHGEKIIQDYLDASTYVVEVLDKYNERIGYYENRFKETNDPKDSIRADGFGKMIDAARIARSNIDAYFINSGAASCQDLDTIYSSKIEANKDNIDYLNKVISVMSMLKCTEEDSYLTASEYALAIQPTAKAAMGVGFRYFKKGEVEKAMELFDQAINLETSVTNKAEMCYKAAVANYSQKKYSDARKYALKAIELNSKYGMPYILIAQCYAAAPNWHSEPVMNQCTYYAVLDKLYRAKAVDPSVAKDAQKFINSYSTHTPKSDELFMRGYNKGQTIKIGGWINETTTIR
ncbi:MAG: hypothetical protein IJW68_04925 [Bacteroidaceae bacterium]|nr:hypothetical protein [Bacteroidaceae bacterium]MBQ8735998.1 hypothetical protein [Bacteroidaceae bacterium]